MTRTLVFDIDDTISVHHNRDYPNAEPIQPVIDKINRLKEMGYCIKLYTARGQNSCKGDLRLIQERNEPVLREWLRKHGVMYDELIFGKPLADWYIDDKAMSVETFLEADFEPLQLRGGSGSKVWLEDKTVIKTTEKAAAEHEWYLQAAKHGLGDFLPRIYSRTLDTLYMEYIPGTALADEAGEKDIDELLRLVKRFRAIPDWRSDIGAYCENLLTHSKSEETEWVIREIQANAAELTEKVSFSHGDLSLSNVIRSTDGSIKIIDPNNKGDYSSYLLDLAKIRFSMTGYERLFGFGKADLRNLRDAFDRKTEDGRLVQLLEITHWIRLYKYRTEEQRKTVDRVIDELIKEYGERWS